jgi:hypothetical protein
MVGVVSPPPNPQAGGTPTVGCPRLRIQYIRRYRPYPEAVSCISYQKTRHTVVTVDTWKLSLTNHINAPMRTF